MKPMLTANFADDLTNPPQFLKLLTTPKYTTVMIPGGPDSYGRVTLAHPAVWASALQSFCSASHVGADDRCARQPPTFGAGDRYFVLEPWTLLISEGALRTTFLNPLSITTGSVRSGATRVLQLWGCRTLTSNATIQTCFHRPRPTLARALT